MTSRLKKTNSKKMAKPGRVGRLFASLEDDVLLLADEKRGQEGRWNRPRKKRISVRVDVEVLDWLRSKGPGYQTRINRILRTLMIEGKRREGEKGR